MNGQILFKRFKGQCMLLMLMLTSITAARPTTTRSWFRNMQRLASINGIDYLNTESVTDMGFMFQSCRRLTALDVSDFNTENVKFMGTMFNGCNRLETIYAGKGWSTSSVTYSDRMFYGCTNLVGGKVQLIMGSMWMLPVPILTEAQAILAISPRELIYSLVT